MRILKQAVGVLGTLAVIGVIAAVVMPKAAQGIVATLVQVVNTPANPVPVQHVKESAANFLTLTNSLGSGYNEVLPDGLVNPSPFALLAGQQFVITDVSWVATCGNFGILACSASSGDAVTLQLAAYFSTAIYAPRSGFLVAGGNDHMTSGMVVSQLPTAGVFETSAGNGESILVTLQGYVVP